MVPSVPVTPLTMLSVTPEQLESAIAILGADGIADEEIEAQMLALVGDAMLATRLIDWLPEAFGIVLVSHIGKVRLPSTFSAKYENGEWVELEFKVEPIFGRAVARATAMYHSGPRNTFSNIAVRSAMVDAVNRALNAGESLEGAQLSGPSLVGIPAEVYVGRKPSFWRRLFR